MYDLKLGLALVPLLAVASIAHAQTPTVRVVKQGQRYVLLRAGKPYFVKGVGGANHLEALVAAGGNSFRTWGADRLGEELERAKRLGLTVCAGIWLGHRRHGFRYDDPKAVREQHEKALEIVRKYKDHPSLLVWGLGNEVELDGDDPRVWKAINDLARDVKRIDPNHPVMTVVAEMPKDKVDSLNRLCPDLDLLGINSYAGLATLPQRLVQHGWTRPYLVTEYGPQGFWEVGKTSFGSPIEPTSTEKARLYADNHARSIANQPQCLGGYAFLWGHKQEMTGTWFGMWLASGEALGAVDAMASAWGKPRANRAPTIEKLTAEFEAFTAGPGTVAEALLDARDPDGDKLTYRWVVQAETTQRSTGGDAESAPPTFPELVAQNGESRVRFKVPEKPGAYRLFVFVYDGKGNAATANKPFVVRP